MYTIPKITMEIKSNVYETIIYTSKLLWNNIELEQAEKFNPKSVEEYFENINAFDSGLYSDDKLKIMKEQYVSGLTNIFSVDTAKEKIKYDVQEITSKLIGKLRYSITLLESDFKNLITKKKQIITLLDKTKKDIFPFIDANQYFNIQFETKEALLKSCQKSLTTAYGGKLFLSHSVEDLLKIVANIGNNLFLLEETKSGRELAKKYDLEGLTASIKYFVSKEKSKEFKREDLIKYSVTDFLKDLNALPKQLKSDGDSIMEFIISLHNPDPNKQPDTPAVTSEMFNETLKSIMMAWSRASGIFDADLRVLIEETSGYDLKPLLDTIDYIDECNRKIINKEEIGGEFNIEKELTTLKNMIEILNAGTTTMYFLLECKVYDILRYLINFDFFQYIKNLMLMLYLNYRNDEKNSIPSNTNYNVSSKNDTETQQPTPEEGAGETPKPEQSNPNPETNGSKQEENQNQNNGKNNQH